MRRYCITIADRGDGIYQPEAVEDEAGQFVTYEAANARIAELEALLGEAIESIEDWSGYAIEYFREKHGLAEELARFRAALDKSRD